jgi:hypothetical protein
MKCDRCGLAINYATQHCPACGYVLSEPARVEVDVDIDFYELFELSPKSTISDIKKRLRDLTRYWGNRANISSKIEQRQEAERMLHSLAKAEKILLDPQTRAGYDQALLNVQQNNQPFQTDDSTRIPVSSQQHSDDPFFANNYSTNLPDTAPEDSPVEQDLHFSKILFNTVLSGTVVNIDPIYMSNPDFRWGLFIIKIIFFGFAILIIGPIVIGVVLGLAIASAMFSSMFSSSHSQGSGFLSNIFGHLFNFLFTRNSFREKELISVRDIRLRDQIGQEHLVRIKGDIVSGNINVGDEIEVTGINKGGTMLFRRGWNKRIKSEIKVKRR